MTLRGSETELLIQSYQAHDVTIVHLEFDMGYKRSKGRGQYEVEFNITGTAKRNPLDAPNLDLARDLALARAFEAAARKLRKRNQILREAV